MRAVERDDPATRAIGESALQLHRRSTVVTLDEMSGVHGVRIAGARCRCPPDVIASAAASSNPGFRALVGYAIVESGDLGGAVRMVGPTPAEDAPDYSLLAVGCLQTAVCAAAGMIRQVRACLPQFSGDVVTYGSVDHLGAVDFFTAQPVGHGANGSMDKVLLLRTRALNSIDIDLVAGTATVGAGVKVGELLAALKGTGLTFLAGSGPDPTVVGMTITGGMSWFGRAHGLAANAIVSAKLVDGMGRVRVVRGSGDAELLWALRGGGGDLGIITSLGIRLWPGRELYGGRLLWPVDQMPAVLRAFRQVTVDAPEELSLWYAKYQFAPLPQVPEVIRGKAFAGVAAAYLGPRTMRSGCCGRCAPCRGW